MHAYPAVSRPRSGLRMGVGVRDTHIGYSHAGRSVLALAVESGNVPLVRVLMEWGQQVEHDWPICWESLGDVQSAMAEMLSGVQCPAGPRFGCDPSKVDHVVMYAYRLCPL